MNESYTDICQKYFIMQNIIGQDKIWNVLSSFFHVLKNNF